MPGSAGITERLRDRLVGDLHLGRLHSGDRLPAVREVAAELGVGVRAAVRAYRELEREGLVEIRSRSGVYVAPQERLSAELLEETARWLAETLVEAVKRRIPIPHLPELLRRYTGSVRPRCVLLESTEDHLTILGAELRDEFGFDVEEVNLGSGHWTEAGVAGAVEEADIAVTTTFHAAEARGTAERVGTPLVIVTVHPEIAATLERRLSEGSLTVVCADPAFGERVVAIYADRFPNEIRVVPATDREAVRGLGPADPVLLTLAARQHLGSTELRMLLPHSPSISPESARELAEILVRFNIDS